MPYYLDPQETLRKKCKKIRVSESLRYFLTECQCNSRSTTMLKYYLMECLNPNDALLLDETVFSKIFSVSESNDGYVIINDNQKMKLGKLAVTVGEKLCVFTKSKGEVNAIEHFIDQYKSWYKSSNQLKFKTLKGTGILYGYDTDNHKRNSGMLRGSCMNNKPKSLRLYVNNHEKIELLVLVDDEDKIYGRALLWKLDNKPFVFMDRVYGVDNYVVDMFNNYAKSQKMIYREQEQTNKFDLYLPDGKQTNSLRYPLKVRLNTENLKYLPYMDSLYIWNKWGNVFSTSKTGFFLKFHCLKNISGTVEKPGLKILGIKLKNDD